MTANPSAADLWWLAEHATDLADARLKGTPRPWRQIAENTDPERQEQRRRQAVDERRERSELAIGEHPAPVHVNVLDLLVDLVATSDDLAERVAQAAGVDRMPPASSAFADPAPYLRYAAAHLFAAEEASPGLAAQVQDEAARLRTEVSLALGLVMDGQTLQACCPWCRGGPQGELTLRVRTLPGGATAVVCHGVCEPPAADVGTWWRGQPAWPLDTEGEWLADRIRRAEEAA